MDGAKLLDSSIPWALLKLDASQEDLSAEQEGLTASLYILAFLAAAKALLMTYFFLMLPTFAALYRSLPSLAVFAIVIHSHMFEALSIRTLKEEANPAWTSSESDTIQRLGFSVLAAGEKNGFKPVANIVFVHGLRGHPRHTWEQKSSLRKDEGEKAKSSSRLFNWGSHKRSASTARADGESAQRNSEAIYWPQDLLPRTISDARILTYGYDADIIGGLFKGASKNNITEHGRDLMLKLEREVEGEPIIFVAHSLGGILVKEGLHWSKSHISPRYQQLHRRTKHVIFLGVPHRGSDMAKTMGETLTRLATVALRDTNKHLVSSLEVEDELLDRINSEFLKMVHLKDFSVYSFQESSGLSGLKGFSGKVVSGFSSKLDHPLETVETIRGNHMEMARFGDVNDDGYRTISKVIARCVTDSQQVEKPDIPPTQKSLYSASPGTKEKRFFRIPHLSNHHFIGRKKEMSWLQGHLEDLASSEEQQRAAIWGPGGAGKTQLVSTYAYRNRPKYSAIFWVTASNEATLRRTYADIAKYLDLGLPSNGNQQTSIDAVRDWLMDHKRGDWLLVIDNADKLEEVDIQSFIPPINKGSVIITSRNRRIAELGTALELGEMDAADAVGLLFLRAGIHHPTLMEEATATEITKCLGYLALAIEHAGAYVQSIGGTIQDYLEHFQNNRKDTLEKSPAFSMHKDSVVETFNMSFSAVLERNVAAAKLLCFMSFLDVEGVLESSILSINEKVSIFREHVIRDGKEFFEAIQVLMSFSLIRVKIEEEKKCIFLHPLVHYLSRARLKDENRWLWKARVISWLVELSVAANTDLMYFPHVREQMEQMKEIESFPSDIQRRRSLYYCLALLQHHYQLAWQNQGAMAELHEYSEIIGEVLEEDLVDQEHLSIVAMMNIIAVQATTIQFISSDKTHDQIILRYLSRQMTPSARTALEIASDSHRKCVLSKDTAEIQSLLPKEENVELNSFLNLQTLTTALTEQVIPGPLAAQQSIPEGKEVTQAIEVASIDRATSSGAEDGPAKIEALGSVINSPITGDQGPNNESISQAASPVIEGTTKGTKNETDVNSPSTAEPKSESISFQPKCLDDVFLSVTPPIRAQCLLACLNDLVKIYYSHNRRAEADLLMLYSSLPVNQTKQADQGPLQVSQLLIQASRVAAIGDLQSVLSIFLKVVCTGDATPEVYLVSIDYAVIMNKLGQPAEAERVIKRVFFSKGTSQSIDPVKSDQDLARNLPSTYVWFKKILSTSQRLQGKLDQSLENLLMTLQTTQAVFGMKSLSYLHAILLLHRFYKCHHPQSQSKIDYSHEARKYRETFVQVLESLYCSGGGDGKQSCNVECLQMGIILWAQGALEEAAEILDAFAQLTEKKLGENDALARRTRKAAETTKREWEVCQKERREDILKFGTATFPRNMEKLALLLENE